MTRPDEIFSRLSSLQYVEAEVLIGRVFALVREYDGALQEVPADDARYRVLSLLAAALRQHAGFLTKHPSAVFQCFWNTCWWHDCAERREFRVSGADAGPLSRLMEQWRTEKARDGGIPLWIRSLRPPSTPLSTASRFYTRVDCSWGNSLALAFEDSALVAWRYQRWRGEIDEEPRARAWDLADGAQLDEMRIATLSFPDPHRSRDGALVVPNCFDASGWGTAVCVADARTGDEAAKFAVDDDHIVNQFAFSADGSLLAAAGYGGEFGGCVYVWDVRGRVLIARLNPNWSTSSLAFSPDGRQILTGSAHGDIDIWDIATARFCRELPKHGCSVDAVAWSPSGTQVAVGGEDGSIRVWDLRIGPPAPQASFHPGRTKEVKFSPSGHRLVTRSANGTTGLWDGLRGGLIAALHESSMVVMMGGDSNHCVFAGEEEIVSLVRGGGRWASADGRRIDGWPRVRTGLSNGVAFSPDGLHLAIWNSGQRVCGAPVVVFEITTGRRRELRSQQGSIDAASFSADGRYFAFASSDGAVAVWDFARDTLWRSSATPLRGSVTCCAVSADGTMTATAGRDSPIRVLRMGVEIALIDCGEQLMRAPGSELRFLDGDLIAARLGEGSVGIWNYKTGAQVRTSRWCGSLANFSLDAEYFAHVQSGEFCVTNAREVAEVAWLPCPGSLSCETARGPDGQWIWAGHDGQNLYHFALEGSRSVI